MGVLEVVQKLSGEISLDLSKLGQEYTIVSPEIIEKIYDPLGVMPGAGVGKDNGSK